MTDTRTAEAAAMLTVPLYRLAHSRTGDKGNRSNISVIAWHPALWDVLVEQVTEAAVAQQFAQRRPRQVTRYLLPQLQAGFFQQTLFRQRYVALLRAGHPLAARPQLTATAYRQAAHVRVVAAGTGHGRVDEALQRLGVERRVQLTVPHYVALGHVLGGSDLIATVPERFADRVTAPFGLVARPLTLKLPASHIAQLWHAHLHRDAGHQWLRGLVAQHFGTAAGAVDSP